MESTVRSRGKNTLIYWRLRALEALEESKQKCIICSCLLPSFPSLGCYSFVSLPSPKRPASNVLISAESEVHSNAVGAVSTASVEFVEFETVHKNRGIKPAAVCFCGFHERIQCLCTSRRSGLIPEGRNIFHLIYSFFGSKNNTCVLRTNLFGEISFAILHPPAVVIFIEQT